VTAVRCRVEYNVFRAAFDPAFEDSLQRLVRRIVGIERKIVAKNDEALRAVPQI
jgi:hypothetical protein